MTITAVLMAHYPERINNIQKIIQDLKNGTRTPDEIIVFVDTDDIDFVDDEITVIRSSKNYDVISRLYAASFATSEYVFLIDDDLTVQKGTLEHFVEYAEKKPFSVLGFEGNMLSDAKKPYTMGITINRGDELQLADVLIRTYFCPKKIVALAIYMYELHRDKLSTKYTDDLYLCLNNRLLSKNSNWVIPFIEGKGVIDLPSQGVGLSKQEDHYDVRDTTCRYLIDRFQGEI